MVTRSHRKSPCYFRPATKRAVKMVKRITSRSTTTTDSARSSRKVHEGPIDNEDSPLPLMVHGIHQFTPTEISTFQRSLLVWYDVNKRDLPWRKLAEGNDPAIRAYAVLVSEIMLQQTQVITVKQYYEKWMARWPTFQDLAHASLEQVNEMWAGLGYYARGRRLYETAKKIVDELDGKVPQLAAKLQEQLPGVGRYTAGAVASISFGEKVAAVDGNVIRVLSRIKLIGGDSSSQAVTKEIWKIAEGNVDSKRPGDFNQAMMELGAVICTPKSPNCGACPVKNLCLAYKTVKKHAGTLTSKVDIVDIESVPDCVLCIPKSDPWELSAGVMNLPRKAKKVAPRKQETAVAVLHRNSDDGIKYLLMKRPSEGLLANLWEFPSCILEAETEDAWPFLKDELNDCLEISEDIIKHNEFVGNITHIFSHIHQTYIVYGVSVAKDSTVVTPEHYQEQQWVSEEQFFSAAVSTGMKKIFKSFSCRDSVSLSSSGTKRRTKPIDRDTKKSKMITDFFTKSGKKS